MIERTIGLEDLLSGLDYEAGAELEIAISGLSSDSRLIKEGWLFVAVTGVDCDGYDYIEDAVRNGAGAIITERAQPGVKVGQIIVRDARKALARVSENFYHRPGEKLTLIGITGTNGKTTSAYLIESILKEAGFKVGVIGTVNYRYGNTVKKASHTTPPPEELSGLLGEMVDNGVTHCVMELSSHALKQKRADALRFKSALFTNLTPEHFDYHDSMEDYFESKAVLFTELLDKDGCGVINEDDLRGQVLKAMTERADSYGMGSSDIHPDSFAISADGIEAEIKTPESSLKIESTLVGDYNLMNIMGAVGVARSLDIDEEDIEAGVKTLRGVPGRVERILPEDASGGVCAYVDYAHTSDALFHVISALRPLASGRLITVFGCGGDRDREKRPEMGRVATKGSNITILTSDNPRSEDPFSIIAEIEAGLEHVASFEGSDIPDGPAYTVVPNRGEAIERAVEIARAGDIVLIAGKGHEDYQLVAGKTLKFDDRVVLSQALTRAVKRTGSI